MDSRACGALLLLVLLGGGAAQAEPEAPYYIYFAGSDQFLRAEVRQPESSPYPETRARAVIQYLAAGPRRSLTPVWPKKTEPRALYIDRTGVAYVDLPADFTDHYWGGVRAELLTIYALVNSLITNVPEIKAVRILINGQEAETLAGHIDISTPLTANMLLVR